jgi:hypothetical protein
MKAAKPVEIDNKAHKNQSKKQKPKDRVVVPLSEVQVANVQTQKAGDSSVKNGSGSPGSNTASLTGGIPMVHGLQTIYDQGSEIMYKKHQESLAKTGDANHPETRGLEESYVFSLNTNQVQDYHDIKSETDHPKTAEEQPAKNKDENQNFIPEFIPQAGGNGKNKKNKRNSKESRNEEVEAHQIKIAPNQRYNGSIISSDEQLDRFAEQQMKLTRKLDWGKLGSDYVQKLVKTGGTITYNIPLKNEAVAKEIADLPEEKKRFLQVADTKLQTLVMLDLFKELSPAEMADFKSKTTAESSNPKDIENSLRKYIKDRNQRKKENDQRESITSSLKGADMLEVYHKYKTYKKSQRAVEDYPLNPNHKGPAPANLLQEASRDFNVFEQAAKAMGYTTKEFVKLVKNYELAFRKETVHIAEDALQKYKHTLFEQKKKLLEDTFLTNLLGKIKASKAKESYEESQKATPYFYDRNSPQQDKEFSVKMNALSRSKKLEGNAAIKKLSSETPLIDNNGFNKEAFAKIETKRELHDFLEKYINKQEVNIARVIKNLHSDQSLSIYGYASLLEKSKEQQGVAKGSIFDLIIADKESEESTKHIIEGLLIGALAVALGLLSFGTGTVAVLLAAGNFALGAYLTYEEIEAYRTQLAAYEVNISESEPSAVWVIIAVVGSVLDVAAVAKISKTLVSAGRTFELTKDIGKTEKVLIEAGLDPATRKKVIKALESDLARVKTLENKIQQNTVKQTEIKTEFNKSSREFLQATATFNTGINLAALPELVRLADLGIKRGITTFEGFLLELQLKNVIKSVDSLTDDELKIIKDAFSKVKNNDRVAGAVDNLYDEIDISHRPKGFESLSDVEKVDPKYGRGFLTKFADYEGYFYRNYDDKKKIFTFNHGFSNDLPKWVEDVKVPLVEGKGIPTQAYFTLRQMKLLEIAEGEIEVVRMAQIQNLDTAAFIHQITEGKIIRNFDSIDILDAPSNAYMKTVMTQAGYETISAKITGKGQYFTVKDLQKYNFPLNPKFNGSYDAFMKEHGLTLSDRLYINYNIEVKVKYVK